MTEINLLTDKLPLTDEVKNNVTPLVFKALSYFNQCDIDYRRLVIHGTKYKPQPTTLEELIQFFKDEEDTDTLDVLVDDLQWEVEENN